MFEICSKLTMLIVSSKAFLAPFEDLMLVYIFLLNHHGAEISVN